MSTVHKMKTLWLMWPARTITWGLALFKLEADCSRPILIRFDEVKR